jgi:hypothetical protein
MQCLRQRSATPPLATAILALPPVRTRLLVTSRFSPLKRVVVMVNKLSLASLSLATGLAISMATLAATSAFAGDSSISGAYLEARTCQVYTGPCFANSEVGLAGKDAIMAWNIESGSHQGVDLSGLKVVVVIAASDTLGHRGVDDPEKLKSLLIVDEKANDKQRAALADFAQQHAGRAGREIRKTTFAPIEMSLDLGELTGKLHAGKAVALTTRKARQGDCICSNETAFYPPLAKLSNFVSAVTMTGEFSGRGLGVQWSIPDSRSAYMGLFHY